MGNRKVGTASCLMGKVAAGWAQSGQQDAAHSRQPFTALCCVFRGRACSTILQRVAAMNTHESHGIGVDSDWSEQADGNNEVTIYSKMIVHEYTLAYLGHKLAETPNCNNNCYDDMTL